MIFFSFAVSSSARRPKQRARPGIISIPSSKDDCHVSYLGIFSKQSSRPKHFPKRLRKRFPHTKQLVALMWMLILSAGGKNIRSHSPTFQRLHNGTSVSLAPPWQAKESSPLQVTLWVPAVHGLIKTMLIRSSFCRRTST